MKTRRRVAQSAERLPVKEKVAGSSPALPAYMRDTAWERVRLQNVTVGGSNPSSRAFSLERVGKGYEPVLYPLRRGPDERINLEDAVNTDRTFRQNKGVEICLYLVE